jgi:hypothetical protein
MTLAGATLFLSACSYFLISTPAHYAKAADILDSQNGNVLWLEDWNWNRRASVVCAAVSAAIFATSYFRLWRAQRYNLDRTSGLPEGRATAFSSEAAAGSHEHPSS